MSDKQNKRFYVCMTWEEFPAKGCYRAVIEARSKREAAEKCRERMAERRAVGDAQRNPDIADTAEDILTMYGDDWHSAECREIKAFIEALEVLERKEAA